MTGCGAKSWRASVRRPAFPPGLAELTLTPGDWRVVGATDGHRSIAALTAQTHLDAFDVCLSLHKLLQAGVATIDLPAEA